MEGNGTEVSDAMSDNDDETETFPKDDDDDDRMAESTADGMDEAKKNYDLKDPSRPRRKKARRACYACQRAHLTCGKSLLLATSHADIRDLFAKLASHG